jgi:hypothetical protein
MKLKNMLYVVGFSALLQGCSTPALDMSQLPVYPDNRVGYTMSSRGSSFPKRVWSSGETILALRFGTRLINARDIDTMFIQWTDKKNVPVYVAVRLKSGERVAADVADFGNSLYSDILVEWLACNRSRACEYLERSSSSRGRVTFQNTPNFLTSFDESFFDSLALPGGQAERYLSYRTDAALPYSRGIYQLRFTEVEKISDLSEGVEIARAKLERVKKCVAQAGAEEERNRKMTEEKIIRETPPTEVQKKLAMWRASLNTGFAQMLVLDMSCQ